MGTKIGDLGKTQHERIPIAQTISLYRKPPLAFRLQASIFDYPLRFVSAGITGFSIGINWTLIAFLIRKFLQYIPKKVIYIQSLILIVWRFFSAQKALIYE